MRRSASEMIREVMRLVYNMVSLMRFPLISHFPMYRHLFLSAPGNLPVAEKAAARVLCLPIHPGLDEETVTRVCGLVGGGP